MAICDDVIADDLEDGVFTLERVRQCLSSGSFPFLADLNVFLLLSSARKGTYPGKVLLIEDETNKTRRYLEFQVTFAEDHLMLPTYVELSQCQFPGPGSYTFEGWFTAQDGREVQKAEQPFLVLSSEE